MIATIALLAALQQPPAPAASAAPSPAASAAFAEDPATTKVAKQQLAAWQAGTPDWSLYTQKVDDATVKKVKTYLGTLGPVTNFAFYKRVEPQGVPFPVSVYTITGKNGSAYEIIHVNTAGKIDGIFFRPAQAP